MAPVWSTPSPYRWAPRCRTGSGVEEGDDRAAEAVRVVDPWNVSGLGLDHDAGVGEQGGELVEQPGWGPGRCRHRAAARGEQPAQAGAGSVRIAEGPVRAEPGLRLG